EDGLVTPEEAQAVAKANEALEEAKAAAKAAIEEVPEARRGELSKTAEEVEALPGGSVSGDEDNNANGTADDTDVSNAQDAIAAAELASQKAQQAATTANEDGLVTPEEAQAVAKANERSEERRAGEKGASEEVPEARRGELSKTAEEVEALPGGSVSGDEDNNANGTADDTDVSNAQDAIAAAELASQKAQQAATTANEDGLVTPEEAQAVAKANE